MVGACALLDLTTLGSVRVKPVKPRFPLYTCKTQVPAVYIHVHAEGGLSQCHGHLDVDEVEPDGRSIPETQQNPHTLVAIYGPSRDSY